MELSKKVAFIFIEGLAYVLNSPYGSWLSWRKRNPRRMEGANCSEVVIIVYIIVGIVVEGVSKFGIGIGGDNVTCSD